MGVRSGGVQVCGVRSTDVWGVEWGCEGVRSAGV